VVVVVVVVVVGEDEIFNEKRLAVRDVLLHDP
jgi:hypothetical protein